MNSQIYQQSTEDQLHTSAAVTNPRSEALAVRLEAGATALAAFAATLSEAEWQTRLPKDGRKVGLWSIPSRACILSRFNSRN